MEPENSTPNYDDSVYEFVFDRLQESAPATDIVNELVEKGIPHQDAEDLVLMAQQVDESGALHSASAHLQNAEDSRQMMWGAVIALGGIICSITFQHFFPKEVWLGYICVLPIGYGALRFFMAQQRLKRSEE